MMKSWSKPFSKRVHDGHANRKALERAYAEWEAMDHAMQAHAETLRRRQVLLSPVSQQDCCIIGFAHVHPKRDGLLFVRPGGYTRFLNWREALVWRLFGALPPQ